MEFICKYSILLQYKQSEALKCSDIDKEGIDEACQVDVTRKTKINILRCTARDTAGSHQQSKRLKIWLRC
jgi:hypothetical protein